MPRVLVAFIGLVIAYITWRVIALRLKDGAELNGVSWRMFFVAIIIEPIFFKRGVELVLTSGTDGEHSEYSLHYEGLALDVRSRDVNDPATVLTEIRQRIEPLGYAAILEGTHFHIQWTARNIRNYATLSGAPLA